MTRATLLCAALATAACSPDFDPASRLAGLRLLAIRADPPEIAPAPGSGPAAAPDRAALTALVLRADFAARPGRATTVLYLACLPEPGDPSPSGCAALASLRDPAALARQGAGGACGAPAGEVRFLGVEACTDGACGPARVTVQGATVELPTPVLAVPAGWGFDALPPGDPARILGVQAQVLALALDAAPDELAAGAAGACPAGEVGAALARLWATREHVLATKSVRIRGPEAPDEPNLNPAAEGLLAGAEPLASAPPTALRAGTWALRPVPPADAEARHQSYLRLDAAGNPVERRPEEWVHSWFSTAGEIEKLHSREAEPVEWKLGAGEAASSGGRALVAAAVRDLRGGTAWVVREVRVE